MTTLAEWTANASQSLMSRLPGHTHETTDALVDNWILVSGGWTPDDIANVIGDGAPTGGETPTEAADIIAAGRVIQTETVEVLVPLVLKMSRMGNYPADTSETIKLESIKAEVETIINGLMSATNTIDVVSYGWGTSSIVTRAGGSFSVSERVAIDAGIDAGNLLDPAAMATNAARAVNSLNTLWIASQIYVSEVGEAIYVTMDKYTDATFVTIDPVETSRYIVRLDPVSHVVQTLVKLPKTE